MDLVQGMDKADTNKQYKYLMPFYFPNKLPQKSPLQHQTITVKT